LQRGFELLIDAILAPHDLPLASGLTTAALTAGVSPEGESASPRVSGVADSPGARARPAHPDPEAYDVATRTYLLTQAAPAGPRLYDRLARDHHADFRRPLRGTIRSGRAWPVRAGQLCRIVTVEGPQVADFNAWHLHNPRERFWASRTKQLHRAHVTTGDRLWSTLPYLRPMATITNDTLQYGTM
jgi:uncharacterized protein YcgI (DUF1989 family)